MTSYCLKCKKNTENINPKVLKTNNGKTMLLSKFALCGSKKSRFIKKLEAIGKVLKHHWVKSIIWSYFILNAISIEVYKMNEIVNKFLLAEINLCLTTRTYL